MEGEREGGGREGGWREREREEGERGREGAEGAIANMFDVEAFFPSEWGGGERGGY